MSLSLLCLSLSLPPFHPLLINDIFLNLMLNFSTQLRGQYHFCIKYHTFLLSSFFFHFQCHGLWDEDDPKENKEPPRQSESEDEVKDKEESEKESEPASSLITERRGSNHTLRSINFGTSIDSGQVQVHYPQQQTYQRRKSSSGGSHVSHRSLHSSARSKRGEGLLLSAVSW